MDMNIDEAVTTDFMKDRWDQKKLRTKNIRITLHNQAIIRSNIKMIESFMSGLL